jgi:asparaginyl-tRNA synthetase
MRRIAPRRSWTRPDTHYLSVLDDPWYTAVVALQSALSRSTHRFWDERDVPVAHLPVTTGSVSSPMGLGSDSAPVCVDLFGQKTYLADSMQFGLEYLCRLSGTGAYYLMPSFRGEDCDSTHLCQFFHSEAELPGDLDAVMDVVEAYVRRLAGDLLHGHADAIAAAAGGTGHVERLLDAPAVTRLTFDEAVDLLGGDGVHVDGGGRWRSLTRAGERALLERCGPAVWVTDWDELAVPFYQARDETTGRARNADLLLGPGEVVGCGERHVTGDEVLAALRRHEVDPASYDWYVQVKRQRPLRTAGFGLGVERFLMWLLDHGDIRDLQVLVRENGRGILP